MTQSRFDKLNVSLQRSGLDAVVLNPGPTLTHLTGLRFHLMERPVVWKHGRAIIGRPTERVAPFLQGA